MYFVLFIFITSPVLTASSLIYVTTHSVTVTNCPSINTSSGAAQHPVHTPQPETHAATTLHHL